MNRRNQANIHITVDTEKPKPTSAISERLKVIFGFLVMCVMFALIFHFVKMARIKKNMHEAQIAASTASEPAHPSDYGMTRQTTGSFPSNSSNQSASSWDRSKNNDAETDPTTIIQRHPFIQPSTNFFPGAVGAAQAGSSQGSDIGDTMPTPEQVEVKLLKEDEASRHAPLRNASSTSTIGQPTTNIPPSSITNTVPGANAPNPIPNNPGQSSQQQGANQNSNNGNQQQWTPNPYDAQMLGDMTRSAFGMPPTTLSQVYQNYGEFGNAGRDKNQNDQAGKEAFARPNSQSTLLQHQRELPPSLYMIMQGEHILAALEPTIKSDLPGEVTAVVRNPVYDSLTGKYVLIPARTKIVGYYNSIITYAQRDVQVAWTRLIFPDTTSLNLDKMMAYSSDGSSGLHDKVDNHWKRIIGGVLLSSVLSAGVQLSQNHTTGGPYNSYPSTGQVVGASIGEQASTVGSQITSKNLSIQPSIKIRPGANFYINVNKDIAFDGPYTPKVHNDE